MLCRVLKFSRACSIIKHVRCFVDYEYVVEENQNNKTEYIPRNQLGRTQVHKDISYAIGQLKTLKELRELVVHKGNFFNAINLSAVLSKLAKLNDKPEDKIKLLDNLGIFFSREMISQFQGRMIANALWGLAKLEYNKHGGKNLIKALLLQALAEPGDFNALEISQVMWVQAKTGICHRELCRKLIQQSNQWPENFEAKQTSTMLWSLANLGLYDAQLVEALLDNLKQGVREFAPVALANVIWSCGQLRHYDRDCFEILVERAQIGFRLGRAEFTWRQASQILYSLAVLNYFPDKDPNFIKLIAKELIYQRCENIQSLVNSVYSLAILEQDVKWAQKLVDIIDQISSEGIEHHLNEADLRQLYFAYLLYQEQLQRQYQLQQQSEQSQDQKQELQNELYMPQNLLHICGQAWIAGMSSHKSKPSQFQQKMEKVIVEFGFECVTNKRIDDTFVADFAVEANGQKIAVILEGGWLLMQNDSNKLSGQGVALNRLIAMKGWKMLIICTSEWSDLYDLTQRRQWLLQKFGKIMSDSV